MPDKRQAELEKKIQQLQHEAKLMRQLATASGFYKYWYSQLPNFNTRTACFHYVNDLHYDFFGTYRYSSYNTFLKTNQNKK